MDSKGFSPASLCQESRSRRDKGKKRRAIWQSLYARRPLKVLSGVYLYGARLSMHRGTGSHCKIHYFSITRIASVIPFDRYTLHRGPAVARTRENSTSFHREGGRGRRPVLKTVRGRSGRSLSKTVTLRDGQCKLRWRIHMCREAV